MSFPFNLFYSRFVKLITKTFCIAWQVFSLDGRQYLMILSNEGYKHIILIDRETKERIPITSGSMVVNEIYHWDEEQHLIYFQATPIGKPRERHLYSVTDNMLGNVSCLSCLVTDSNGDFCSYNFFILSFDNSHYFMSCLGPNVPQHYLYKTEPNEKIQTLVTNERLSAALAQKNMPKVSHLDLKIAGGKYDAKVKLFLPPNFDEQKKYPLLVYVYAGPNSQQVNDRFNIEWDTYLTTSEGTICAYIDGRGSGFRGDDLMFEIYHNLGGPEIDDQLDVTRQLIERHSFIDNQRWPFGVGLMEVCLLQV